MNKVFVKFSRKVEDTWVDILEGYQENGYDNIYEWMQNTLKSFSLPSEVAFQELTYLKNKTEEFSKLYGKGTVKFEFYYK